MKKVLSSCFTTLAMFTLIASQVGTALASDEVIQDLKSFIPAELARLDIPGVSVALISDGKIAWAEGFGVSDVKSGRPVDANTMFPACSASKPVSAVGVLKFAENGKLNLDEPIERILKTWTPPANPYHAPVTTRLMLCYRGGMNMGNRGYVFTYPRDSSKPDTRQDLTDRIKVTFEPGTRYSYSGGSHMVMQVMLEDISGMPYNEVMEKEVLRPLGMDSSTYDPCQPQFKDRVARGYLKNGRLVPKERTTGASACWLHTTPSDLARFMVAMYDGYKHDKGNKVLSADTIKMMLTPMGKTHNDSDCKFIGLGMKITDSKTGRYIYHPGSNTGFKAFMCINLDTGDGITVLTNSDKGRKLYGSIRERALHTDADF